MKTYLESEGKLDPKFQPQANQFRPTQPNTNPHVRKETRATEKRKKLIPTKKYKVQAVARPEPTPKTSNATAQIPLTTPVSQQIQKSKILHKKVLKIATSHHLKISQLMLAPHGQRQEKMS